MSAVLNKIYPPKIIKFPQIGSKLKLVKQEKKYTVEEFCENYNLTKMIDYIDNLQNENGFTKLFTIKVSEQHKEIIKMSIMLRDHISKLNNLPAYMARSNQDKLNVKSISSEVVFSVLMRSLNKGSKCTLEVPELATITPNKSKTDIIMESNQKRIVTDIKSQYKSSKININKKAHERAMSQGLSCYIIGIVDSDVIEDLTSVTFYHLPLNYFYENHRFIDNSPYCLQNHNNDYCEITLKDIKESIFFTN